jgi:competence protein ComEC
MRKLLALILALLLLTGCGGKSPEPTPAPTEPPQAGSLKLHFIDVGQADAILLECNGEFMMVDGGNVADSSLVVRYLEDQGVTKLEAVVATHAHEDHVGGLPGVLAVYETAAVYAPTRTYASNCFDEFVYYTDQQGLTITIPNPGDVIEFGDATATVLGPVKSYAETNNTSIVLMVQYRDTRFLLTGDMETEAENDMLDYWGEGFNWSADLLKVGHHGSDTSTGYRFLNEVMPSIGVISVGKDNSYGHPCEAPLSKLRDADVWVYRTDELGNILAISDGTSVAIAWEVSSSQPDAPGDGELVFIGNKNSKKLHLSTCGSVPSEKNRVYFDSYDEAIAAGYVPCANCLG